MTPALGTEKERVTGKGSGSGGILGLGHAANHTEGINQERRIKDLGVNV
jgi:hypothetical protein